MDHEAQARACPRLSALPEVHDRLHLFTNLQESSHQKAGGPREFASVQPALACSRRPLVPVRGPITKRKRGRILGVGYGGVGALHSLSGPITKRKRRPVPACSRRPILPLRVRFQSASGACPRLFAPTDSSPFVLRFQSASGGEFLGWASLKPDPISPPAARDPRSLSRAFHAKSGRPQEFAAHQRIFGLGWWGGAAFTGEWTDHEA